MKDYHNLADYWWFRLFKAATILAALSASLKILHLAFHVYAHGASFEYALTQSILLLVGAVCVWLVGRLCIYVKIGSAGNKRLFYAPLLISFSPLIALAILLLSTTTGNYKRELCMTNLAQIDNAKQQWALENGKKSADTCTFVELLLYLKNQKLPVCPAGGTYTITTVSSLPTCSVHK